MARRTPKYSLHRATGQAFVRLAGRMVYLGAHGTEASLGRYHAALATFFATGEAPPSKRSQRPPEPPRDLTIAELFASFNDCLTVQNFVLTVLAPFFPALLLGARQCIEQLDAASRLDRLKDHAATLWNDAMKGKPEAELTAESRNLQDEIFESRRRSPLVFDFVFKLLQPSYDRQMNFGVAELVAEAFQQRDGE